MSQGQRGITLKNRNDIFVDCFKKNEFLQYLKSQAFIQVITNALTAANTGKKYKFFKRHIDVNPKDNDIYINILYSDPKNPKNHGNKTKNTQMFHISFHLSKIDTASEKGAIHVKSNKGNSKEFIRYFLHIDYGNPNLNLNPNPKPSFTLKSLENLQEKGQSMAGYKTSNYSNMQDQEVRDFTAIIIKEINKVLENYLKTDCVLEKYTQILSPPPPAPVIISRTNTGQSNNTQQAQTTHTSQNIYSAVATASKDLEPNESNLLTAFMAFYTIYDSCRGNQRLSKEQFQQFFTPSNNISAQLDEGKLLKLLPDTCNNAENALKIFIREYNKLNKDNKDLFLQLPFPELSESNTVEESPSKKVIKTVSIINEMRQEIDIYQNLILEKIEKDKLNQPFIDFLQTFIRFYHFYLEGLIDGKNIDISYFPKNSTLMLYPVESLLEPKMLKVVKENIKSSILSVENCKEEIQKIVQNLTTNASGIKAYISKNLSDSQNYIKSIEEYANQNLANILAYEEAFNKLQTPIPNEIIQLIKIFEINEDLYKVIKYNTSATNLIILNLFSKYFNRSLSYYEKKLVENNDTLTSLNKEHEFLSNEYGKTLESIEKKEQVRALFEKKLENKTISNKNRKSRQAYLNQVQKEFSSEVSRLNKLLLERTTKQRDIEKLQHITNQTHRTINQIKQDLVIINSLIDSNKDFIEKHAYLEQGRSYSPTTNAEAQALLSLRRSPVSTTTTANSTSRRSPVQFINTRNNKNKRKNNNKNKTKKKNGNNI